MFLNQPAESTKTMKTTLRKQCLTLCFFFLSNYSFSQTATSTVTLPKTEPHIFNSKNNYDDAFLKDCRKQLKDENVDSKLEPYEFFCNLHLGHGFSLMTVVQNSVDNENTISDFYLFTKTNNGNKKQKFYETNSGRNPVIVPEIISFPKNETSLIWIGDDGGGLPSHAHIFGIVDGQIKEILNYIHEAHRLQAGTDLKTYLVVSNKMNLCVVNQIYNYTEDDTTWSDPSFIFKKDSYKWDSIKNKYVQEKNGEQLSFADLILILGDNEKFLSDYDINAYRTDPDNLEELNDYIKKCSDTEKITKIRNYLNSLKNNSST